VSDLTAWLNGLKPEHARVVLLRCCGSERWADSVVARRPFNDFNELAQVADEVWAGVTRGDVLEAMSHHPRIGADLGALRERYAATKAWSSAEQAGVNAADEATLVALRDGNQAYEARFGHIFLVCATGKSAAEMLGLLQARLGNDPADELEIARQEQGKITRIRLEKLTIVRSPLTTHVLDTARGKPAAGLHITLERFDDTAWIPLAEGVTNTDGRVADLLAPGSLKAACYRITFFTGAWYAARGEACFYPEVPVVFEVSAPEEHHHVPLLLSPFGFSTYRGS
jgi:hydroxyisourate hydrolase